MIHAMFCQLITMFKDIWFFRKNDRMEKEESNQIRIFHLLKDDFPFHPFLPRFKQLYIFFKIDDINKILSVFMEFQFRGIG